MSLCVENIWPRVKEVNMTFLESSSPCLINMEKKKNQDDTSLLHIPIFSEQ